MDKIRKMIFLQARGIVFGGAVLSVCWWLIAGGFVPNGIFVSVVAVYLVGFGYIYGARGFWDVLNPDPFKHYRDYDDEEEAEADWYPDPQYLEDTDPFKYKPWIHDSEYPELEEERFWGLDD